jgi:hypothetical protein
MHHGAHDSIDDDGRYTGYMTGGKRRLDGRDSAWRTQRQRLRLECRECEVICERVVSPWRCLKSSCPYVYTYKYQDTAYFGCLYKVFAPELDIAPFVAARQRGGRASDPYGHLRVVCSPRPECPVAIEQAYAAFASSGCCCNPTFFLHPQRPGDEGIRLITNIVPETETGSQS